MTSFASSTYLTKMPGPTDLRQKKNQDMIKQYATKPHPINMIHLILGKHLGAPAVTCQQIESNLPQSV
jgi:hypothetical protein